MPALFMISPARKKKGMARRAKESVPPTMYWGIISSGRLRWKMRRVRREEHPMEKTRG
jgi:hypothetical protein